MLRNHDVLHLRPALALNLNNPSVLCTAHVPWKRWAFWASACSRLAPIRRAPKSCGSQRFPRIVGCTLAWRRAARSCKSPQKMALCLGRESRFECRGRGCIHRYRGAGLGTDPPQWLANTRKRAIAAACPHLSDFIPRHPSASVSIWHSPLFLFRSPLARAVVYLRALKPAAWLAAVVLHLERPPNPQLTTGTDPAPDASHVPAAAKKKRPRMQETLRRPSVSKPHISLLYHYDYDYYDYCYYYCYHYCYCYSYCYCYYYHYSYYYYSSSLSSEDDDDEEHLE